MINANLEISCLVECPHCEYIFNLFEMDSLTNDGYIYDELMPIDDTWGKENWGEIVACPECHNQITIKEIVW